MSFTTFGYSFFVAFCLSAEIVAKGATKHAKGFGGAGGNVKIMVFLCESIIFMVGGVPERLLCSTLRTMFFNVVLRTTFLRIIVDFKSKRGSG